MKNKLWKFWCYNNSPNASFHYGFFVIGSCLEEATRKLESSGELTKGGLDLVIDTVELQHGLRNKLVE